MANWCEGELKIRGEYENIKRFLKSELKQYDMVLEEGKHFIQKELPIDFVEGDKFLKTSTKNGNQFYLDGSRRGFIYNPVDIEIEPEGKIITKTLGTFSCAWGLDTDVLIEHSKTYNLDFKIYAYERGMQFNEDFEVHKGDIIIKEIIEFDDYLWECTNTEIGG